MVFLNYLYYKIRQVNLIVLQDCESVNDTNNQNLDQSWIDETLEQEMNDCFSVMLQAAQ